MFHKKKQLSSLDIKSILLIVKNYNATHENVNVEQEAHVLGETLRQFGVNVEEGRVPCPPRSLCYSPNKDLTTTPPKSE